jgi:hypothetical protein
LMAVRGEQVSTVFHLITKAYGRVSMVKLDTLSV